METAKNNINEKPASPFLFVVLVPHRESLPPLETYRRTLFANGILGAFSFPPVSPLALLKRPLKPLELKNAARELRKLLGSNKIVSAKEAIYNVFAGTEYPSMPIQFFGTVLEMPLPAFPEEEVIKIFEKPILGPAIIAPGETIKLGGIHCEALSFRTAALSNLVLKPVSAAENADSSADLSPFEKNYSFSWELGHSFWLPKPC